MIRRVHTFIPRSRCLSARSRRIPAPYSRWRSTEDLKCKHEGDERAKGCRRGRNTFGSLETSSNTVNTKTPVASILAPSPSSGSLVPLLHRYIDNVARLPSSKATRPICAAVSYRDDFHRSKAQVECSHNFVMSTR